MHRLWRHPHAGLIGPIVRLPPVWAHPVVHTSLLEPDVRFRKKLRSCLLARHRSVLASISRSSRMLTGPLGEPLASQSRAVPFS